VTNEEFFRFTESNPDWGPKNPPASLDNGNYLKHWKDGRVPAGFEIHPVVNVTWYAAVAYCQSQGKRLPTEAEWEHAARGGEYGTFPWGNAPADESRANYSANKLGTTTPVGTYPPNKYGLSDMAGNVWQFTADEWVPYSAASARNPIAGGASFATGKSFMKVAARRVIRGGSWGGAPLNLWVEYRDSHPPNGAQSFVGFRCAQSAE
jgi:formylglycine-generating enzyme required for sulfatase activity